MKAEELVKDIPIFIDFIPRGAKIRPGIIPETKKFIVIHNTGNYISYCDAKWHNEYIHKQACSEKPREASWHFSVDDREIWQHIPEEESAWHASDGGYGDGNLYGIGIEICVNGFPGVYSGEEYDAWEKVFLKACDNASILTASLMKKYSIGMEGVKQHFDFAPDRKNCPMQMRYAKENNTFSRENGTIFNRFLKKTKGYLENET